MKLLAIKAIDRVRNVSIQKLEEALILLFIRDKPGKSIHCDGTFMCVGRFAEIVVRYWVPSSRIRGILESDKTAMDEVGRKSSMLSKSSGGSCSSGISSRFNHRLPLARIMGSFGTLLSFATKIKAEHTYTHNFVCWDVVRLGHWSRRWGTHHRAFPEDLLT